MDRKWTSKCKDIYRRRGLPNRMAKNGISEGSWTREASGVKRKNNNRISKWRHNICKII